MRASTTIDLTERSTASRFWLVIAGWTAVAIIMALILREQERLPLAQGLPSTLFNYYALGGIVWIVCRINARLELWRQPTLKALGLQLALGLVAVAVHSLLLLGFHRIRIGGLYWHVVYDGTWMYQLLTHVMTYSAGLGLGLTIQALERERAQQRREAELEVAARDAELAVIKAQLQPHFLLNSLNSILALMKHDPAEAEHMVTRLSSLLHSVFDRLDQQLVPLGPELDMIRDYLEIERIRFQDRLRFSVHADGDSTCIQVPPLLLHPIVENAVKHGVAPHARSGEVCVTAHRHGNRLQIAVSDTGDGPDSADRRGRGRGIELTQRRLDAVYGDGAAAMHMERRAGGFTVTIDLPASGSVN